MRDEEASAHHQRELVAVIDFGSQYSQLIARRIRECNVYCELIHPDISAEELARLDPRAFVLSGGPASVYEPGAPHAPAAVFESGKPVLGICYGMQLVAYQLGGQVSPAARREYGHATIERVGESPLFAGLPESFSVWMSHGDQVDVLPEGFVPLARSPNSPVAAMARGDVLAIQFHPEV